MPEVAPAYDVPMRMLTSRIVTYIAASSLSRTFDHASEALDECSAVFEGRYAELAESRPDLYEYKVTNGLRGVLAMAASHRSVDNLLRLLHDLNNGQPPILDSDE